MPRGFSSATFLQEAGRRRAGRTAGALVLAGLICAPGLSLAAQPSAPFSKPAKVWGAPTHLPPQLTPAQIALAPKPVWQAPPYKMYAQVLSDEIRAAHPEIQSANLHAKAPGSDMYTDVAGLLFRVGSVEDPKDDLYVIKEGVTIVDPRRGKHDRDGPKYEVATPLETMDGQGIGQLVLVFNVSAYHGSDLEKDAYIDALEIRRELAKRIKSNDQLFERAD
jgi:hypothetical protein